MNKTIELPGNIRVIVFAGAALALGGAIWLGIDLYSGLVHGIFHLVRANPVTTADGFRYGLLVCGESFSILVLLGVATVFAILATGRMPQQKK